MRKKIRQPIKWVQYSNNRRSRKKEQRERIIRGISNSISRTEGHEFPERKGTLLPSTKKGRRSTPRYIIIKFQNPVDKEKTQKLLDRKKKNYLQEFLRKGMASHVSPAKLELKEKKLVPSKF